MSEPTLSQILTDPAARIHLIGVAGSGMSGIAGLLLSLGHRVSGCDRVTTVEVERLQRIGLDFRCPQTGAGVAEADAVIYSSAIREDNPAFLAARRAGKPLYRRAEALAALIERKRGIVVAGMHGKTTVSSMAAHVLRAGGLRPSHYIGAEIPLLGTNAHWDPAGEYFVAEGDESDGTLALYRPEHAIVLNVEEEHLDHYADLAAIDAVFRRFLDNARGAAFYCGDDPGARRVCAGRAGAVSFGADPACDYHFRALEMRHFQSVFEVVGRGTALGQVILNVPGRHNVSNAVGVLALACELGVPFAAAADALAGFRGARRRFEEKYRSARYLVIDDYAHHPSELRATLATAKAGATGRVVAAFQPHRYTRTRALRDQFGGAFADADALVVTDVYPASEPPLPGVTGETIAAAVRAAEPSKEVRYVPALARLHEELGRMARPGDLLLTLGAGDIHEQGAILASELGRLEEIQEMIGAGVARLHEPLAKHTTMRVGGPAQFWVEPEGVEGMARLMRYCRRENLPLMVIGRGSNLLVRDGGVRGVVARLSRGEFAALEVRGLEIRCGVGVRMQQLAAAARAAGVGGFEWFEGIPGNLGGGLRMNAGAMGAQTFDQVIELEYLDAQGDLHRGEASDFGARYRDVPALRDRIAVAVRLRGQPATPEEIDRRLEESREKRRASQPVAPSAGCIFKNPEACPAGRLVEELGLKNLRVGGARVSEVHGNFIVNEGGATAADVLALIARIREAARAKRGIELETEVQVIGEEVAA